MPRDKDDLLDHLKDEIPHLQRFARSLTHDTERADDLTQDCLVRAIERRDQFQPETDLRRWLFTILKNAFIDKQRTRARRGIHVPIEDWSASASHPPEQFSRIELDAVFAAIDDLRREERDIIDLVIFREMRYREVSHEFAMPMGTVKSRLARARHALAERVGLAA